MAEINSKFDSALDRKYLTTSEVAETLRIASETVRYWRWAGTGPKSFKVGARVLYDRDDVAAYITAAREVG